MAPARRMRSMHASHRRSPRRAKPQLPSGPVPKTPDEVEAMAAAGAALAACLDILVSEVRPGVTTGDLDLIAEDAIRTRGATPAFKGYHGFPGSICPSVNAQVVHAIPGPYALEDGDILSIDVGLVPGVVIAIEPMVNAGGPDVVLDPDGWTVLSADGTLSAHAEHTVAVTADGPRVLTRRAA